MLRRRERKPAVWVYHMQFREQVCMKRVLENKATTKPKNNLKNMKKTLSPVG